MISLLHIIAFVFIIVVPFNKNVLGDVSLYYLPNVVRYPVNQATIRLPFTQFRIIGILNATNKFLTKRSVFLKAFLQNKAIEHKSSKPLMLQSNIINLRHYKHLNQLNVINMTTHIRHPYFKNQIPSRLLVSSPNSFPNITGLTHELKDFVSTSIENQTHSHVGITVHELLNHYNLKDAFKLAIPLRHEKKVYLQDIYCNITLFPGGCSTLSEWGKSIGIPLQDLISSTRLSRWSQRIGHTTTQLHDDIIKGMTPTMINFLEKDAQVKQFEKMVTNVVSPFIKSRLSKFMINAITQRPETTFKKLFI